MKAKAEPSSSLALVPLRWVVGWLFFSALWRRTVLSPSKLDVWAPGSLAEKTNHFLPHALDPGQMLEWTLRHPELLQVLLVVVTVLEGVAGLLLLLGLASRFAGALVTVLSGAILLSAGWLGTTCLDEWQIGVLGIAGGLAIAIAGAGSLSLDARWARRPGAESSRAFRLLAGGELPRALVFGGAVATLALTLATNQIFHGGLWGELHNLSAKPHVEIFTAAREGDSVHVDLMRDEGPDTHGAFVIAAEYLDADGEVVERLEPELLSSLPRRAIANRYIAQVQTGPHGLVLPLGARASVVLPVSAPNAACLRLVEVSGRQWTAPLSAATNASRALPGVEPQRGLARCQTRPS
ncbi:TQO small subunit DoxD [Enhygromyxa salina]|uniref:TQO small subunit DoxD n=1 Tax=Enhygromyxa salina TaxID=215803 RepID=A0A2S9YK30_9BACT|nr:TQO small subunit DoxD [Enhygromyxa salina]PRQ05459.1 TQO small subunit DoxD [Enhygromyxa salina]